MTGPAASQGAIDAPADLVAAIVAYLDHLRVERGLARLTLAAYATDLRLFAVSAPHVRAWARSADPARGYLSGLARPPRPLRPRRIDERRRPSGRSIGSPSPRSSSSVTSPACSTCRVRRADCPTPSMSRRSKRCWPRPTPTRRVASGIAPSSSCSMPRACASPRRSGSTARTSRWTAASCASSARATRSAWCRSATWRSTPCSATSRPCARAGSAVTMVASRAAGRSSSRPVGDASGAWPPGGPSSRPRLGGAHRAGHATHAPTLLRDAPARGRR